MAESPSTVVGVFEAREHADQAVEELRQAGFRNDQIGVACATPAREGGPIRQGKGDKEQDSGLVESVTDFFKGLFGSSEEAGHYEEDYRAGRTVVTVKAEGPSDEPWAILRRHGAYNRAHPPAATAGAGPTM